VKRVLVTGANGFIGRNLVAHLARVDDCEVLRYDLENDEAELRDWLGQADVVFHLAGVNRPQHIDEYESGNAGLTSRICEMLCQSGRTPKIVMSSSIQAEQDNPYGVSKRRAEEALTTFSRSTGAPVSIYRLRNVFGKWCRPNYNSVTATFCHSIAHDLPISISDPRREIDLVYVEDVVARFVEELQDAAGGTPDGFARDTIPSTRISLGELAGRIQAFHEMKANLMVPDFADRFNRCLYATYLSYVEPASLEYGLTVRADSRGSLAEFVKSHHFGQVFVSRTYPGITRGNHYHHTKTEKFLVLAGTALIRLRHIEGNDVVEHHVRGEDYRVVDIPPGHTHSITNAGDDEMITLFWASEVFDPDRPDTYYLDVAPANRSVGGKV
jgi:UDP-2-acetamido-2,6-beta-L-arabino-hexul-4-ose reductase